MTKSVKNLLRKLKKTETKLIRLKTKMRLKQATRRYANSRTNQNIANNARKMKKRNLSFRKRRSKQFKKKYPNYKIPIEAFNGRFLEMIDGIYEENLKIALNLKKKGKKIYILSNFPGDQFDNFMKENKFLNEFDDMVISGKVGLKKPDKRIYELAIKKFDCNPGKTLFIDDRPENTEAAQNLGINIITLDVAGKNVFDYGTFVGDGSTIDYLTNVRWTENMTHYATIDGVMQDT